MIDETNGYEKYELKEEYPPIPNKPTLKENTPAAARAYADALEQYEKDKVEYQKKVKELDRKRNELWKLFQEDLILEDLNAGLPREACERAYNIAMELSDDYGRGEIIVIYEDIIEVARITYKEIHERN